MIWGERDATAYPHVDDRRRILCETQPGARFTVIPGAGHWVQFEAAERFNEVITEYAALLDERFRSKEAQSRREEREGTVPGEAAIIHNEAVETNEVLGSISSPCLTVSPPHCGIGMALRAGSPMPSRSLRLLCALCVETSARAARAGESRLSVSATLFAEWPPRR